MEEDNRLKFEAVVPEPPEDKSYSVRKKVTRACDFCKSKKLRCSGTWPCSRCMIVGNECQFLAGYKRGKLFNPKALSDVEQKNVVDHIMNQARSRVVTRREIDSSPMFTGESAPTAPPGPTSYAGSEAIRTLQSAMAIEEARNSHTQNYHTQPGPYQNQTSPYPNQAYGNMSYGAGPMGGNGGRSGLDGPGGADGVSGHNGNGGPPVQPETVEVPDSVIAPELAGQGLGDAEGTIDQMGQIGIPPLQPGDLQDPVNYHSKWLNYIPEAGSNNNNNVAKIEPNASPVSLTGLIRSRLQNALIQKGSKGANAEIFIDPELPQSNGIDIVLPPREDARHLVNRYFDYSMATFRFLHQPTCLQFLDNIYDTPDALQRDNDELALLLLVMALSKRFMTGSKWSDNSASYLKSAEGLLDSASKKPTLTRAQARLAQVFYLLTCSRINQAREIFALTIHLIHALGLHRKTRHPPKESVNFIVEEMCKRTFWCAFMLDKHIAVVLGRPPMLQSEDQDQAYPALANDIDITASCIKCFNEKDCVIVAQVLHIKLTIILGDALRKLYGATKNSESEQRQLVDSYNKQLTEWHSTLPAFFDPSKVDASLLSPLLQRQSRMVTLVYANTLILVNRPFLLKNNVEVALDPALQNYVEICQDAAMMIVKIVNDLDASSEIFPALWYTHYCGFCAVVVLYVAAIRFGGSMNWAKFYDAAFRCQKQLTHAVRDKMPVEMPLVERFTLILEELRQVAVSFRNSPKIVEPLDWYEIDTLPTTLAEH